MQAYLKAIGFEKYNTRKKIKELLDYVIKNQYTHMKKTLEKESDYL